MKKLISATFLFLSLFVFANAQDVIITKDKLKIEAKIVQVNKGSIEYKDFSRPNGETKTILKSEIVSIAYENGIVEVYNEANTGARTSAPSAANQTFSCNDMGNVTYKEGELFFENRTLRNQEIKNAMRNCKPEYFRMYKSGQHRMVAGIVTTSAGLGFCGIGALLMVFADTEERDEYTGKYKYVDEEEDDFDEETYNTGIVCLVAGATAATIGFPLWVSGAHKKSQAIQEFKESFSDRRSSYSEPIHLDLTSHKNQIGLALKF